MKINDKKSVNLSALREKAEKALQKFDKAPGEFSSIDTKHLLEELNIYQIELEMQNEELRKAQEELEETRSHLSDLYDFAPAGYFTFDTNGLILELNLTGASMLGRDRSKLIKKRFSGFIDKDDQDLFYLHRQEVFKSERKCTCELKLIKKDGNIFYAQLESIAALNNDSIQCRTVITDITERKKIAHELELERSRLKEYFENLPMMAYNISLEGIIRDINNITMQTLEYTNKEELIGKPLLTTVYTSFSQQKAKRLFQERESTGRVTNEELQVVTKNGKILDVLLNVDTIYDMEGNALYHISTHLDITDKKLMEEQLQIRQRIDSLGTLAGGLAHDFNNMLAGIIGNLDILYFESENFTDEQKRCLRDAKESSEQAAALVRRFQKLSKYDISMQKSIDVYEVADEVFHLLSRTTSRLIDKKIGFEKNTFFIKGNKSEIYQVLLNLGINSCEAIEEKGVIPGDFLKIDAQKYRAEENDKTGLPEGDYIHIKFTDSGSGMIKDVAKKIFDPYYTTKTIGVKRGQGLGLAMVYNIVTRFHHGIIYPESEHGKNTIMHIYLPEARAEERIKDDPVTEIKGGNETILVVDDEVNILKTVKRILGNYGYDILTASDGEEAIDVYETKMDSIRLVILDLNMPKMSGEMVLERLLELNPKIKVIIFTGYSGEFAQGGILTKAKAFILKPDFTNRLPITLRKVLDS